MGRGERHSSQEVRRQLVRWTAATSLYRSRPCGRATGPAHGRAVLGSGSDFYRQDRRVDLSAQGKVYNCNCDAQYAAGLSRGRIHWLFPLGQADRTRQDGKDFHDPVRQAYGGLHHRQVWIMRTRFQQGLDDLRARLLRMGGLAEQAVDRACQAYIDRDLARCHMVLEGEFQINVAEREIDELAFDLLALQQPIAVDLRFILAVTKINSDLERVGDQAVNIAERAMDLVELPKADLPVDIPRMAAAVSAMVRRALESFIEGKAELAQAVLEMDNVVDRMKDEAFIVLVKSMNDHPETTRQALDALLVARNLERVADHATNIAEDVIFWVRGADVRHNAPQEGVVQEPPAQRAATETH